MQVLARDATLPPPVDPRGLCEAGMGPARVCGVALFFFATPPSPADPDSIRVALPAGPRGDQLRCGVDAGDDPEVSGSPLAFCALVVATASSAVSDVTPKCWRPAYSLENCSDQEVAMMNARVGVASPSSLEYCSDQDVAVLNATVGLAPTDSLEHCSDQDAAMVNTEVGLVPASSLEYCSYQDVAVVNAKVKPLPADSLEYCSDQDGAVVNALARLVPASSLECCSDQNVAMVKSKVGLVPASSLKYCSDQDVAAVNAKDVACGCDFWAELQAHEAIEVVALPRRARR